VSLARIGVDVREVRRDGSIVADDFTERLAANLFVL
jgi:hypothetical protein